MAGGVPAVSVLFGVCPDHDFLIRWFGQLWCAMMGWHVSIMYVVSSPLPNPPYNEPARKLRQSGGRRARRSPAGSPLPCPLVHRPGLPSAIEEIGLTGLLKLFSTAEPKLLPPPRSKLLPPQIGLDQIDQERAYSSAC
eukprot:COSAG06_NODE_1491_length_9280_cov_2.615075_17_plen_137_part_01